MSTVPPKDTPTPAQFEQSPRRELLDTFVDAEFVLVDARHGVGTPRTREDVAHAALVALATARALVGLLLRWEWVTQAEALKAGATLGEVAAASGLDIDEVLAGLRPRIAAQIEHACMPRAEADELLAVIDRAEIARRLFERHGATSPPA